MSMPTNSCPTTIYGGLTSLEGVQLEVCSLLRQVFCPFCMSPDAALLSGKITLAVKMSGEGVIDNEPLAAFLCPNSHFFMVREGEVMRPIPLKAGGEDRIHSQSQAA
jgi:hypothetical protein